MYKFDPHENEVQYLEDVATSYWHSEVLFSAVELGIFEHIQQPKTVDEICTVFDCDSKAMIRFLEVLLLMGLVSTYQGSYMNSQISSTYLIKGKEMYQGDSILWRKELKSQWNELTETIKKGKRIHYIPEDDEHILYERTKKYISAMDAVIKDKAKEIVSMFENIELEGNVLDVGAGSGAFSAEFIKRYPQLHATLFDLENVIKIGEEKYKGVDSIHFHVGNILENWTIQSNYQCIIFSNILHAYSEEEVEQIFEQGMERISAGGYFIIHDFFMEHSQLKAGLSDLNMMINTYNGKVFHANWICEKLEQLGLDHTNLIPLEGDTGVIFASKSANSIRKLCINKQKLLLQKITTDYGLSSYRRIVPNTDVFLTDIASLKCQYGCDFYVKGTCQTKCANLEKTKDLLLEFSQGVLIEGEPPTKDFQKKMLQIEKAAFKLGFYKAFVLWAGPCSLCETCKRGEDHCTRTRPSMESYGIDVFETVRKQGITLKTLDKQEYIKYFGLLLLE